MIVRATQRHLRQAAAAAVLVMVVASCALPHPDLREPVPKIPALPQTSLMLDRNGRVIRALHAGENRTMVPLSEVPPIVRNAVIAIEDSRFYQHHGVDVKALLRAGAADAKAGAPVQGGSTIAEQLVKITITGDDKTLARKARQAVLAYELESHYSKEQILSLYLNTVYFGEGAYGIEAAAETFFSVHASALTLAQGALLAGLIQAPSTFDPLIDPKAAKFRRDTVLVRMMQLQMIDPGTLHTVEAQPLGLNPSDRTAPYPAPYFAEYVQDWFLSNPKFGATPAERYDLLFNGGLRIYTTVDLRLQALADQAVKSILFQRSDPYAAMTVVDPTTGDIRAMVGGRGYFSNDPYAQVNLATGNGGTGRQVGSAFKPFTLVTALSKGITPDTVYPAPSSLTVPLPDGKVWDVTNFEGQGYGSMTLHDATVNSVNTVYAQVVMKVGPQAVADTAHRMGIMSPLNPVPSITLGSSEVTTVDMASGYSTLAAGGFHHPVTGVTKITDSAGHVIYQADQSARLVIDPNVAYQADQIMEDVIRYGTGVQANIGRPAAGKTGTTQDNKDAWFVGFTPQLVAAVWVGFPHPAPMQAPRVRIPAVLGGTWPAEIWHAFMVNATRNLPPLDFTSPDAKYATVIVDVTQGCLPNQYTPPQNVQPVKYLVGTEPTEVCTEPTSPQPGPVPQVTGLSEDVARSTLESYGFQVLVEEQDAPGLDPGVVLSQSPPSGSTAMPGDTVIIVVVAQPAPTPSGPPSFVPTIPPTVSPSG